MWEEMMCFYLVLVRLGEGEEVALGRLQACQWCWPSQPALRRELGLKFGRWSRESTESFHET